MVHFGEFWKPEACSQTVLPDGSVLIRQKLVENVKMSKFKWDILGDFQTMWAVVVSKKRDLLSSSFANS